MTTTTARPPLAEPAPDALARPGASAVIRALGAGSALLVAVHLALVITFVPRWPESTELVAWSAVGVPLAMIAIAIAMWRTGAAPRPLLALQVGAAALVAASSILAAATGAEVFDETLDMWTMLAALVVQYLVALSVLARGAWTGAFRILPIAAASWAIVVAPLAIMAGDSELAWWPFIVYLCVGLVAMGIALAIRPDGGSSRGVR